jgi:hypothetical protein
MHAALDSSYADSTLKYHHHMVPLEDPVKALTSIYDTLAVPSGSVYPEVFELSRDVPHPHTRAPVDP